MLIGWRFVHFGEAIDLPHDWRQSDTANYIYDFYENGIDLAHPAVCWMGGHKTVILEFPLPEAVSALLYQAFGPDHRWARLVTLIFFLGASYYLFRIVALIGTRSLARWTVLFYMAMPLGIFYSRAIHIDFAAVCFAHGMVFHFIQGIKKRQGRALFFGGLWGALAMMTKAPYAFYLVFPLAYIAFQERAWRFCLRHLHWFLLPIVSFIPWQMHVRAVNAAAPDWFFIPHYSKFVDKWGWYFGVWKMRELSWIWETIGGRILYEVLGGFYGLVPAGLSFLILGWRGSAARFLGWWTFGTFIYVFIFFNLNFVHNYYQIPLMVPAACFLGLLMDRLYSFFQDRLQMGAGWVMGLLCLAWVGNSLRLTEGLQLNGPERVYFEDYYKVNPVFSSAGPLLESLTDKDDLLIVSFGGMDCRAPHLLYHAHRNGWSIADEFLSPELLGKLIGQGADYFAWFYMHPPSEELSQFLSQFSFTEHHIPAHKGPIFLYELADFVN